MLPGLTSFVPEAALTAFDNLEFFIRIVLAAALGALVGLERSKRQKEAGVRTHCIIACTSALFMILSKYAFMDLVDISGIRGADPARIAAQVVSGISFLGAGVIFKNGNSIRGLTTAAGMWGTAAVGMAIGAGMYWVGLIEAAILVADKDAEQQLVPKALEIIHDDERLRTLSRNIATLAHHESAERIVDEIVRIIE